MFRGTALSFRESLREDLDMATELGDSLPLCSGVEFVDTFRSGLLRGNVCGFGVLD